MPSGAISGLLLIFLVTSTMFSILAAPVCVPTNSYFRCMNAIESSAVGTLSDSNIKQKIAFKMVTMIM